MQTLSQFPKISVVFFGTPEIAATILSGLYCTQNFEIKLVVTQPDKMVGRKQHLQSSAVKIFAEQHSLEVTQPEKVAEIYEQIKLLAPDFLITCAYGQFIPKKILNLAKREPLNIHGSLLPKYRGGAPIQYAIWNGEQETGVSIMRMVQKMDSGPVFSSQTIPIAPNETSGDLFAKLAILGRDLLLTTLPKIVAGELSPVIQDSSQATFAYNIVPAQEKIEWTQPAEQIHNQIRAFNPQPVAFTTLDNIRYKIYQSALPLSLESEHFPQQMKCGAIVFIDKKRIVVKTGTGFLEVLKIQKAGRNPGPAGVFGLNNFKIGDCFQ